MPNHSGKILQQSQESRIRHFPSSRVGSVSSSVEEQVECAVQWSDREAAVSRLEKAGAVSSESSKRGEDDRRAVEWSRATMRGTRRVRPGRVESVTGKQTHVARSLRASTARVLRMVRNPNSGRKLRFEAVKPDKAKSPSPTSPYPFHYPIPVKLSRC